MTKQNFMYLNKFALLLFLLLISVSNPRLLSAHTDYEEIQVKSTFLTNQKQQLSAISMVWLYDTFSSADMLSHEKNMNRLVKTIISDIARFNYFTRLNAGDRRIVANKINQYKMIKVKGRDNNPALQLTFTLQFNKPLPANSLTSMNIVHADPTGRSLFYYEDTKDIVFTNELKQKCTTQIKEKAEFKQGEFPQIVHINCRA